MGKASDSLFGADGVRLRDLVLEVRFKDFLLLAFLCFCGWLLDCGTVVVRFHQLVRASKEGSASSLSAT